MRLMFTTSRLLAVATLAAILLTFMAGSAFAQGDSPVRFTPGEDRAHPHYVLTPQGCMQIHGPVYFVPDSKGIHKAALASSGYAAVFNGGRDPSIIDLSRGPWHGACP